MDEIVAAITDEEWKRSGYVHLHGVAQACALLAKRRGVDVELATIAGLMHDIKSYSTLDYSDHAHLGGQMAKEALQMMGLFTPAEIEAVSRAISLHSDKAGQHDALTEVLIDADVLQHSLRDPLCDPKPHEAARFEALLAELGVQKRL